MIDHLLEPSVEVNPLYIFFDYKDAHIQTAEKVIASLLKQLLFPFDTLPSALEAMYDKSKTGSPRPVLSDLVQLFITCSSRLPAVVLFDAFDECGNQRRIISELVVPLHKSGIRVCITTRPHVLQDLKHTFDSATIMEIRAQREDIETYLAHQLEQSQRLNATFKADIIRKLSNHADGMYYFLSAIIECRFLLVRFQLDHIFRQIGEGYMKEAMKSLPADFFQAYTQIVSRIKMAGGPSSIAAIRTLTWIFHAPRPLKLSELCEALDVQEGHTRLDDQKNLVAADIVEFCQSLVVYEALQRSYSICSPYFARVFSIGEFACR